MANLVKIALVKIAVACFISSIVPYEALAQCSCPDAQTLQEQITEADAVFTASLWALSEDWDDRQGADGWNFHLELHDIYKGDDVYARVNVRGNAPTDDECSVNLDRDTVYLVYATLANEYGEYNSDLCMGTKLLEDADADLALLGEPTKPVADSCSSLGLSAGLWLLSGPLLVVGRRRRRGC